MHLKRLVAFGVINFVKYLNKNDATGSLMLLYS